MMTLIWFAVAWCVGIAVLLMARFEFGATDNDIQSLLQAALALNPLFVIAALTLMPAMLWANGRIRAHRPFVLPLAGVALSLVPICLLLFSRAATRAFVARAPEKLTRELPLLTGRGVLLFWALVGTTGVVFGIALSVARPTPPREHTAGAFSSGDGTGRLGSRLSVTQRLMCLAGALVVPFVVQAFLLILVREAEDRFGAPVWVLDNADYAVLAMSVLSGFFFVRRGWRAYEIPIAVLYVPAMCYLLFNFSSWLVGYWFGLSG